MANRRLELLGALDHYWNTKWELEPNIIAAKAGGISRKDIIKRINNGSGGTISKKLKELEESGFIYDYTART